VAAFVPDETTFRSIRRCNGRSGIVQQLVWLVRAEPHQPRLSDQRAQHLSHAQADLLRRPRVTGQDRECHREPAALCGEDLRSVLHAARLCFHTIGVTPLETGRGEPRHRRHQGRTDESNMACSDRRPCLAHSVRTLLRSRVEPGGRPTRNGQAERTSSSSSTEASKSWSRPYVSISKAWGTSSHRSSSTSE